MKFAIFLIFICLVGCSSSKIAQRDGYIAVVRQWEADYINADPDIAYNATKSFIEYLLAMDRATRPIHYASVQAWNHARLAILAEHLGRMEEVADLFATATSYAREAYPDEPESRISEPSFRSYLDQTDTPDKVGWRRK